MSLQEKGSGPEKDAGSIEVEYLGQEPDALTSFSHDDSEMLDEEDSTRTRWQKIKDSFKRVEMEDLDPSLTDAQKIAIATARSPLKHTLKNRHLQMIAIGGAIGTGLFVGSGTALRTGGPAGILIGWFISGTMIYCVVMSVAELSITFPVSGGFTTYATRFIDESFGFANNFNYMVGWMVTLPLEIVSASITVNFWQTPTKYRDGFVALFWVVIVLINCFGARAYGEAEFVFSICKVLMIVGFIIMAIVLICGGGPGTGYIGARYWYDPGAFVGHTAGEQFQGFCSVFVTSAFSFAGSELVGLAAAEAANPRKDVPAAAKQVFWRITMFYILCLLLIGMLVPYNDTRLIGSSSSDAAASPFVIAIRNQGISGLPSVVNVVICIAVISVGNSAIYACSRSMTALAEQGFLPQIFAFVDRRGRPMVGIIVAATFGLIAFVAASNREVAVFDWLMAISGLSSLFTWSGICLCHIRFRRGLAVQGRCTDELTFASPLGVWGSYWGLFICMIELAATFYASLFPPGGSPSASAFFQGYLSLPIVLAMYIAHKLWKRQWRLLIPASELDLDTGRRETDMELLKQEIAEEKAVLATKPWWYRSFKIFC